MFKNIFKKTNGLFADNHALDTFYLNFENEFRGSEDDIAEKVIFYAELFKRQDLDYQKFPIIDIGCGRGELLKVLNQYSLNATGIDINYDMVKRANDQGLSAIQADANKYFSKKSNANSLGAVVGLHLIEHIPFEKLVELFQNVYSSLTPGGLVVFETPNPENISVSSYGFYMDPSHLNPIPAPLTEYALRSVGFKNTEILYLNEVDKDRKHYDDPMLEEISNRMYGARDYAVLGYK